VEALPDQARQVAAVVDVGVREHDVLDRGGLHRQRLPVAPAQLLQPLVESAIEEQPSAGDLQEELGAGDGAGASEEL
jgi:hypothetical protein